MNAKIEKLCAALEGWKMEPNAAELFIARAPSLAAPLLRSYDALAEFAEHGDTCEAITRYEWGTVIKMEGTGESCTCGLAEAQRKVAEILKGL